jgi:hypothetical protein
MAESRAYREARAERGEQRQEERVVVRRKPVYRAGARARA